MYIERINEAEDKIRQWHQQWAAMPAAVAAPGGSKTRWRTLWSRVRRYRWTRCTVTAGSLPTSRLLEAVARGDLSPKTAQRLLDAQASTLALLQAVAWGEISPGAAQYVLGQPQS